MRRSSVWWSGRGTRGGEEASSCDSDCSPTETSNIANRAPSIFSKFRTRTTKRAKNSARVEVPAAARTDYKIIHRLLPRVVDDIGDVTRLPELIHRHTIVPSGSRQNATEEATSKSGTILALSRVPMGSAERLRMPPCAQ